MTKHYTDWYQVYDDGSVEYLDTTFEGVTYETVCTSGSGGGTGDDGSGGDDTSAGGGSGDDADETKIEVKDELLPYFPPCETNGEHPALENEGVQETMNEVWVESFGSSDNPLPHDQRNERMFMILATTSGFEIQRIPPGTETSSCHFDGGNVSIPSNIIALVHTHPYSDGDTINDPRCDAGIYDGDGVSSGDESLMQDFIDAGRNITFYVMDKDKIRVIEPSNPSQYDDTINRCGY